MAEVDSPSRVSCWNTIGIWGNQAPRCEKLQDVIHCRNCHVYWDAGRQVFEKNIPDGYLEQWTQALAGKPETQSKVTHSFIYFRLGDEWFSLATKVFVEVAQARAIHRVPHQAGSLVLGVVNVSGAVRLCFSLAHMLGIHSDSAQESSPLHGIYRRYLSVKINDADYVFPVDEVGGVYRYDPEDLKQVPVTVEPRKAGLLLGMLEVKGNNVALLDAAKLGQVFEGIFGE